MATPGSVSWRENAVGLNPAHIKGESDEDKGQNRQGDAQRQEFNGTGGFFTIPDHAEQAETKAQYDQAKQNGDDDFYY
jgi:hypothetical protein